jgi:TrwC relaxase
VWIGSGLDGIDGLAVGDPVTAEQMRALFGCGLHPLAELRQHQLEGPNLTPRDFQEVTQLGAPFKISDGDVSPFRVEVAKRIAAINSPAGLPVGAPLQAADRARVRTEVAREFFLVEHGREPMDARELAGQIAKDSRPQTQTVAGYDLTFSPVKSVSTLWAVADPEVAAVIERAHQAAVQDALAFIETHALFTRTGPQGSGRSTSGAWSRPRSPTATAGPGTRICTPMPRWRTRSRPSRDGGCPSTGECCSKPTWPRRRPTTPRSSSTSATA